MDEDRQRNTAWKSKTSRMRDKRTIKKTVEGEFRLAPVLSFSVHEKKKNVLQILQYREK
jgi:hypothetical protein